MIWSHIWPKSTPFRCGWRQEHLKSQEFLRDWNQLKSMEPQLSSWMSGCPPWPHASCWGQFQHHGHWMCVYRWLGPKMAKAPQQWLAVGLGWFFLIWDTEKIRGQWLGLPYMEGALRGHGRQIQAQVHGPFSTKILWSHHILSWNPQNLTFGPFKHTI